MATDGEHVGKASSGRPHETPADDSARHAASPVLRDLLAADRTRLANERTLLAYVRTAIGFVAAGAGLLYFFDAHAFEITGGLLVVASIVTLVIGIVRYRGVARDLAVFTSGIGLRDAARARGVDER